MMNQGQPKKPDPIYEERLAEMERKYSVVQERIQKYDSVLIETDSLKNKVAEFLDRLNQHINEFVQFKENHEKSFWHTESVLKMHQSVHEKIKLSINELAASHESDVDMNVQGMTVLANSIDQIKRDLHSIGERAIYSDQMQEITQHIWDQIDRVSKEKLPIKAEIDKLHIELFKLTGALNQLKEFPDKYIEMLGTISAKLNSLETEIDGRFEGTDLKYDAALKIFMKEQEDKLFAAKEEIMGTPSSNAKVKEELEKKMEMALLDGSNSVIKVNNIEQQIKLLERKFENLRLLMKKEELTR